MSDNIELCPYNENWPIWFELIKDRLTECLGDLALSIEYIGSTSVPGLSSKNKIDIQVTVREISKNIQALLNKALEIGGFQGSKLTEDHQPVGDLSPLMEWKKFFLSGENLELSFSFNIHIRGYGKKNQKYALLFRDYLRENFSIAASYQHVKEVLVKYHPNDIQAYVDIKDSVCDVIMSAAEIKEKTNVIN